MKAEFQRLESQELMSAKTEMQRIQMDVVQKRVEYQDKCLIDTLANFLGRKITEEDMKQCRMEIQSGFMGNEKFYYNDVLLGEFISEYKTNHDGCMVSTKFYPKI